MLIVILGAAIGLFNYRMGVLIGRKQAEDEINQLRYKLDLDKKDDVWDLLFNGDDK